MQMHGNFEGFSLSIAIRSLPVIPPEVRCLISFFGGSKYILTFGVWKPKVIISSKMPLVKKETSYISQEGKNGGVKLTICTYRYDDIPPEMGKSLYY